MFFFLRDSESESIAFLHCEYSFSSCKAKAVMLAVRSSLTEQH